VTKLFAEVFPRRFDAGFREGAKVYGALFETIEFAPVNRCMYFTPRPVGAPKGAKGAPPKVVFKLLLRLHPELRRRGASVRATFASKRWRHQLRAWDEDRKPAAVKGHLALQAVDLRALGAQRCGLTPRSILDVGCGSGVWSLALARRSPEARVTGIDLPAVLARFCARAGALGLGDRVTTIAGDMHTVPLPEGKWDLAIIANVLRLEQADAARSLITRSVSALCPGGSLLIVDALAAGTPAARQSRAIYAFHLAMRTRSGRPYSS
jgi:SAM-dependent methyltransferase